MAPTLASQLLAIIKHAQPHFRSDLGKITYLIHLYAELLDCTLIAVNQDEPPVDVAGAPEVELPEGWDDGHMLRLCYRTPRGLPLEVKVLQMGGQALVHWACNGGAIQTVDVEAAPHVTAAMAGAAAYVKGTLQALLDTFAHGLESAVQSDGAEAAAQQRAAADSSVPPGQQGVQSPSQRAPVGTAHSGPPPVQPDPLAVGRDDLHPAGVSPGMRPGLGVPVGAGGSQVGPDHPMFQGRGGRPGPLGGSGIGGPNIRFDPIAPDGLPGSRPDDFTPGRRQADAWHDLGPPPGMGGPPGCGEQGRGGLGGPPGAFGGGMGRLGGRRGGGFGGGGMGSFGGGGGFGL